tara:strand:+ start:310 stop:1230 length:921 start_codon:yes stop_codon:yes gene_type:complete
MAFKMKGSPHKTGTMEGTSAHKSALKAYKTMKKYGNDAVKFGSTEGKSVPNKMKSPMEQMCPPGEIPVDKDGNVLQQKSSPNKKIGEKIKKGVKKAVKGVKKAAGKVKDYLETPREKQQEMMEKGVKKVGKHLKDVVKPKVTKTAKSSMSRVDPRSEVIEYSGSATTKKSRKKLFGGGVEKEVTTSYSQRDDEPKGDKTKTTSKKTVKRRSGDVKKTVEVSDDGTRTITKYDKKGNVKKVKTKKDKRGHYLPGETIGTKIKSRKVSKSRNAEAVRGLGDISDEKKQEIYEETGAIQQKKAMKSAKY